MQIKHVPLRSQTPRRKDRDLTAENATPEGQLRPRLLHPSSPTLKGSGASVFYATRSPDPPSSGPRTQRGGAGTLRRPDTVCPAHDSLATHGWRDWGGRPHGRFVGPVTADLLRGTAKMCHKGTRSVFPVRSEE